MSLFGTYAPATQTVSPPLVQTAYAPEPRTAPPPPRADRDQVTSAIAPPNGQTDRTENNFDPEAKDAAESDFTFWDFLDIINPLQHIPLVNTLYREMTGDEISTASRLVGGTLYGGPLGFASALANELVRDQTGKDIGENVIAMFTDDDTEQVPQTPTATAIADNGTANDDFTDSQVRTAGEVFPQLAMNMSGPSGIPNAPPPRAEGAANRPTGLPDYTAATARVVETAPLPDAVQASSSEPEQAVVPQNDPRLNPRGPLFTTEPGFSPYNRPDANAGTAAAVAEPATPKAGPAPRSGINAQTSHPYLDLGPTALPNAAVGRIGGPQPKIVTELQKPPVMPQGLMGGAGAMPGLPGASGSGSMGALNALNAGAGGMPNMPTAVPAADPMRELQQGWSQTTPGLDTATPAPVAFEKAMFMALNKYDQMQAEKSQPGASDRTPENATAVK